MVPVLKWLLIRHIARIHFHVNCLYAAFRCKSFVMDSKSEIIIFGIKYCYKILGELVKGILINHWCFYVLAENITKVQPEKEEAVASWEEYLGDQQDPLSSIMIRFPDGNKVTKEIPCSSQFLVSLL